MGVGFCGAGGVLVWSGAEGMAGGSTGFATGGDAGGREFPSRARKPPRGCEGGFGVGTDGVDGAVRAPFSRQLCSLGGIQSAYQTYSLISLLPRIARGINTG